MQFFQATNEILFSFTTGTFHSGDTSSHMVLQTLTMRTVITEGTIENAIVNQQTCLKPFNVVTRDTEKQISRFYRWRHKLDDFGTEIKGYSIVGPFKYQCLLHRKTSRDVYHHIKHRGGRKNPQILIRFPQISPFKAILFFKKISPAQQY